MGQEGVHHCRPSACPPSAAGVRHHLRSAGTPRVRVTAGTLPGLAALPARPHPGRGHRGALQQCALGVAQHLRLRAPAPPRQPLQLGPHSYAAQ
eukprot:7557869-Pyramimonas_sp.AAC.1